MSARSQQHGLEESSLHLLSPLLVTSLEASFNAVADETGKEDASSAHGVGVQERIFSPGAGAGAATEQASIFGQEQASEVRDLSVSLLPVDQTASTLSRTRQQPMQGAAAVAPHSANRRDALMGRFAVSQAVARTSTATERAADGSLLESRGRAQKRGDRHDTSLHASQLEEGAGARESQAAQGARDKGTSRRPIRDCSGDRAQHWTNVRSPGHAAGSPQATGLGAKSDVDADAGHPSWGVASGFSVASRVSSASHASTQHRGIDAASALFAIRASALPARSRAAIGSSRALHMAAAMQEARLAGVTDFRTRCAFCRWPRNRGKHEG